MSQRKIATMIGVGVGIIGSGLIGAGLQSSAHSHEVQEISGIVTHIQDLYVLEDGAQSGFYQRSRQLTVDGKLFYLPTTGQRPSSTVLQLQVNQRVELEVDENRTIQALVVQP